MYQMNLALGLKLILQWGNLFFASVVTLSMSFCLIIDTFHRICFEILYVQSQLRVFSCSLCKFV